MQSWFMFIEDDELHTIGYVSEEFPTHCPELASANENMLKDIKIAVNDISYSITENLMMRKSINFTAVYGKCHSMILWKKHYHGLLFD